MEGLIEKINVYLKTALIDDPSRLTHIYSVEKMALTLGRIYHVGLDKLSIAALLHDSKKNEDFSLMKKDLSRFFDDLMVSQVPKACLHAYAAAVFAKETFFIEDQDILNAIIYHCSGRASMSDLEQIIYVSDYIEVNRPFVNDALRKIAYEDINKATAIIIDETIQYLTKHQRIVSSYTIEAQHYYKKWR